MGCSTATANLRSGWAVLPPQWGWPHPETSIISDPKISCASAKTGLEGSNGKSRRSPSAVSIMARHEAGDDGPGDLIERREEFVDLRRGGVGDKNHVLVVHRELLREQIGFAVPEVETVDDRRDALSRRGRYRLTERPDDGVRLVAEQEHAFWFGQIIAQSLAFCESFAEGDVARVKGNFGVAAGCTKDAEGLRNLDQGDGVAGLRINVFCRILHQLFHRDCRRHSLAGQPDEGFMDRGLRATRCGDELE